MFLTEVDLWAYFKGGRSGHGCEGGFILVMPFYNLFHKKKLWYCGLLI